MNNSGCGVVGTGCEKQVKTGEGQRTSSSLNRDAKRKENASLSFHAFPRDVSTVAENFRVFWKGVEAKASVGEKRGG